MSQVESECVTSPPYTAGADEGAFMVGFIRPVVSSAVIEPETTVGPQQPCHGVQRERRGFHLSRDDETENRQRIIIGGRSMIADRRFCRRNVIAHQQAPARRI